MKTKIFLTGLLLSFLWLNTGCLKGTSYADSQFDANYQIDLNVNIPSVSGVETPASYNFVQSTVLDPLQDSTVYNYKSIIKAWKVVKISAVFVNVSKAATLKNCTLAIESQDGKSDWFFPEIQIQNNKTLTLSNEKGQWDELEKSLLSENKSIVSFAGTTSDGNFSFDLSITINSRVTASVSGF